MIPDQCDPEKASTTLSSDEILLISAPVKPEALKSKKEKVLQIEHIKSQNKAEEINFKVVDNYLVVKDKFYNFFY